MQQSNSSIIVAHRGASGLAPENTLASFDKALEFNVGQIETDARLTSDGVVVLLHDGHMNDPSGELFVVSKTPYDVLKAHKPDLTTLDEAIAHLDRRVRLMIEIKSSVPVAPVVAIVRKYLGSGWSPQDFIFASFDFDILKELYRDIPEVDRVVLEVWSSLRARYRAKRVHTNYLSMDQWFLWWFFVKSISKKYRLYSYPDERVLIKINHTRPSRWAKHGLYGVITDFPDRYASRIDA